jgi:hypothetical protein
MIFLCYLRDLIISNFGIKIYALLYNKKTIYFNNIFQYSLYLFPFFSIFNYIKIIKIIYIKDNIYNITNINQNKIIPIILNYEFKNNNEHINMTSIIKYYNSSIPLYFFIKNNNLERFNYLYIKYFMKGQIYNKEICISSHISKSIYELFE